MEEQQIRCWERNFKALSEDELVKLVERYPMYLAEIQMVADRIITAARIEDADTDAISLSSIEKFIARLRNRRTVPLLFGMS